MFFDAHNHWHDPRLDALDREETMAALQAAGLSRMVVNGTCPDDWTAVRRAAERHPGTVMPAYGVHPWKTEDLPEHWRQRLIDELDRSSGPVGIGEIGLDRWIQDVDFARQEDVFREQWQVAVERNLPATVHCLRAWGPLMEALQAGPVPSRGFLVHSPGASPEIIEQLAALGAYFSISGYFADPRRLKYHRALEAVPLERLLIETDAPDMLAPEAFRRFPLHDPRSGDPLTHPGNLPEVYRFVATHLDIEARALESRVAENFDRFFLSPAKA